MIIIFDGKRESFKVVILGKSFVGKTSIVQRLGKSIFVENYKPTVGSNITAKSVEIDGKPTILLLTDVAGHQFFEKAIGAFLQRAKTVLLVYAIDDRKSFEELSKWYNYTQENAESSQIMVIGNKVDLADERVVSKNEAFLWSKERNLQFLETSAKTTKNIDKVLDMILESIKS